MEMTNTGNEFCKLLKMEVERTFYRNFRNIGRENNRKFFNRIDRKFEQPKQEDIEYFRHLRHITGLESGLVEIIYKAIEEVATDIYRSDIIRLGKNTERLRSWFQEAQKKSRDCKASLSKKEAEVKVKEQIILQKNEKIDKISNDATKMRDLLNKEKMLNIKIKKSIKK
ncbi:hypothetical protein RclHR1_33350002 [Rhizophagus clarus]|uniref:Uncharacterized protein n=1 Tax=Rhizophagus clarus TaxID=94130 RepID=A0A2Z6R9M8_9GLOM|nr:hypothetical protein RclHR1_33350002 [Rhizophagus clarus]GES87841.1 hypothetical protein RCL_jg11291.t1 [Rhizophagus clarus]